LGALDAQQRKIQKKDTTGEYIQENPTPDATMEIEPRPYHHGSCVD